MPQQANQAADEFVKVDPFGIGMAFIAMGVVFSVLTIIFLTFKYISKVYRLNFRKKENTISSVNISMKQEQIPAETSAAIALALHLFNAQQHDIDSLTLTINKVSRIYSPWSSKIYTLRQSPR